MFSRRTRWICAPCVGVACCLFIFHQFFPSLFSLLIDYYPVVVCTTIFLVILLSLAEPNFPWNRNVSVNLVDTNSSLNISSVTYDLSARNDEWSNSKNTGSRGEAERLAERTIVLGDSSHNAAVKIEEFEVNQVDATSVSSSSVNENNSEKDAFKNGEESTEKPAEVLFKVCKDAGSGENCTTTLEKINLALDQADDSCLHSPWDHVDHKDASSDSGSDGLDLPISNVAPVIDELDPLVSRDNSDDGWVASSQTNASDDNSPDEEEIEIILDDEDDEEEQEDKEDENKGAITWTVDDQRNVVELGNSEIEKNQCLENVFASRKAKKTMEKSLTGLKEDRVQILQSHGQLASVNVPRRNPFDLPYDSSDESESFPGSAPSVLLLRRNPFDLPFEQVVEFVDNSIPREFAAVPQCDAFTSRSESFSVGSVLELKPEESALSFKPYFIPEQNELDDMAFLDLHRESSEVSDSKMSSSDSDTGSSSTDQEPVNDMQQDNDSSTKDDAELIKTVTLTMEVFKPVDIKRIWSQVNPYDDHVTTHPDLETDDVSQESLLNRSISDGERAKEIDDGQHVSNSLNPTEANVEPEEQTHGGSSEGSTAVSDGDHNEAVAKLGEQTHGGSSKGWNSGSVAEHVKQEQVMPEKQKNGSSLKGSNAEYVEEEHAPQGEQTHGGSPKSSTAGSDAVHVEEVHAPSNEPTHGDSSKGSYVGSDNGSSKGLPAGSVVVHAEDEHVPLKDQTHGGSVKGSAAGFNAVHVEEEEHSHQNHVVQPVYDPSPRASERSHPNAAPGYVLKPPKS